MPAPVSPRVDLRALAPRLPARPVTRFAPSPTGLLHLGHLVNVIYVWGIARALGGTVRLRLEDHDRQRSRREYESAILDDLEWLGFFPDSPSVAEVRADDRSNARQSDRPERYTSALALLRDRGLAYWCDCSRQLVRAEGGTADGELRYSGRCRTRGLGPGGDRGVRARLDDSEERFEDGRLGMQIQHPAAQCGDVLARDRHGQWTYQFAVTVDDMTDGVDLVIRGTDLLPSTGRQMALARLLGRAEPAIFVHHPLILAPTGEKLSKSNRDVGLAALREAGVSPQEAIGRAAAAVGLIEKAAPLRASEVSRVVVRGLEQ
jgi:glutamyl-tRNA synthetase/glutamyl-Q tRNA(Asp) synthetase